MQGLVKFKSEFPSVKTKKINQALKKGKRFIRKSQRDDGSWYGSWAVCFTYGTWFGIEGLLAAGEDKNSPEIVKACEFLVSKQKPDGSWGESFESCIQKKYIEHDEGQLVNTAWALLGLMAANYPNKQLVEKGIKFLLNMQEENGDWPQQAISGVFNGSCMITYTSYRNIFPLWALGRFVNNYQP
jgi:squalene cyclase